MVSSRRGQIKNSFAENRLFTIRSIVAGVVAAVLLLTVAGRLFYLQVLKYQYYSELSQGNRIRNEPIPPSRGLILDRNGLVLADNAPAFNLELIREQVGDNKAMDAALAHLVGIGVLHAEEVGANAFLKKPFTREKLLKYVITLLDGPHASRPSVRRLRRQ